jgi:hypothetical protein
MTERKATGITLTPEKIKAAAADGNKVFEAFCAREELLELGGRMMIYEYKRPEGELYKVPHKQWCKTFGNRRGSYFATSEVYLQEDSAVVHHVVNWKGKLLVILGYPIFFLLGILEQGVKETHRDIKRTLNCKKYGAFSTDVVYKEQPSWVKIKKLIGEGLE